MRIKFTDRFCAHAGPGEYFDETTTGLTFRVRDTGRKTFNLMFTSPRDGKRARCPLGTYPGTSLAQARGVCLEALAMVARGEDPRAAFGVEAATTMMTVATLTELYLSKRVRGRLRSSYDITRRFTRNVLPVIGTVKVSSLHKRDINLVLDRIVARGSPVEADHVYNDLNALLRWAKARGDLDYNPIDGMTKPGGPKPPRDRALSDDEIKVLWDSLPTAIPEKAHRWIIQLALVTAQRLGEIVGMRRSELNLKTAIWSLPGSRVKNGYPHQVPLSPLAISIISEALANAGDSDFVFPHDAGSVRTGAVSKAVRNAQARFGIAQFTTHDLRRSALTQAAKLGVAPVVLGHIANHRTMTRSGMTLGTYVHHDYQREKAEALHLWADRLVAITSGKPAADIIPLAAVR